MSFSTTAVERRLNKFRFTALFETFFDTTKEKRFCSEESSEERLKDTWATLKRLPFNIL